MLNNKIKKCKLTDPSAHQDCKEIYYLNYGRYADAACYVQACKGPCEGGCGGGHAAKAQWE